MGLVPVHGDDVPPEKRWSFCGEPYSFEKYLTFYVEQLDDKTRSEMAQLGLLGYQFKHFLPLLRDWPNDGHWVSFTDRYIGGSHGSLHDVVVSTMAWHIKKEIEAGVKRANAAQFGKSGFAP